MTLRCVPMTVLSDYDAACDAWAITQEDPVSFDPSVLRGRYEIVVHALASYPHDAEDRKDLIELSRTWGTPWPSADAAEWAREELKRLKTIPPSPTLDDLLREEKECSEN